MKINLALPQYLILGLLIFGLLSCSDDNEPGNTASSESVSGDSGSPQNEPDNSQGTPGDPANTDSSNPVFVSGNCGSIPTTDTSSSTNIDQPALFSPNSVVGGRIDPDAVTNKIHYWDVDLIAGSYHLVLDSATIDGRDTNIGLKVTELNLDGVELENPIRVNKVDKRTRAHAFLEVKTDQTLRLEIQPNFGAEDYLIGVFQNTLAVPSPHFTNCFPIGNMAIGAKQNIALLNDDEQWFTIDFDAKDYKLTVDAARTDGDRSNIIYQVTTLDRFGQASREKRIIRSNEVDTFVRLTGSLNVTEPGTKWIRVRNQEPPLTLDATFTED